MCISTTEALHTVKVLIKDDVYECCEASMDKETVTEKLEKLERYIKKIDKSDYQKEFGIVVVPTIIVFNGKEVKRFQADLSFKMLATREDVQGVVDEIIMSDF